MKIQMTLLKKIDLKLQIVQMKPQLRTYRLTYHVIYGTEEQLQNFFKLNFNALTVLILFRYRISFFI